MSTQIVEAFLLIEQPRQRLGHWSQMLAALDAQTAPRTCAIVAYYDPTCDQALLDLQYDAQSADMKYVAGVAELAELIMVQPSALSEGERVRFLADRLTRCTIRVTSQRTAVGALGEIARKIRDARLGKAQPPPLPAREDAVTKPMIAQGTRDDMKTFPKMLAAQAPPKVVQQQLNPLENPDRHRTVPMPFDLAHKLTTASSKVIDLDALVPPTQPPTKHGSAAQPLPPPEPREQNTIYARYLRGGRWVPVRIGALSLKGAALLSGALPRLDDRVDVALIFGANRAIVRGRVNKVSSAREASSTGASTFTLSFELDDSARRQLTALLLAARDAKITIKPPPPRATRRFPVEWQVSLGTLRGGVKAVALDVSTFGMFVQAASPLQVGSALTFSVMLDDGRSQLAGRARVVREIKEGEARVGGLTAGFGLLIVSMSESDRMRWIGFLARIERRAEKRVLIGADAARLAELQAGLASLGYAVTGGTDPGALVQLANAEARPADAVLIDADWLQNEASATLVESLFNARNVPCVTMHGEARRARQAIDRLLEVVV